MVIFDMFFIKKRQRSLKQGVLLLFFILLIVFFISLLDFGIHKEIEAVREAFAESRIHTIVLDPGHGGDDKGIESTRHNEKDVVLDLSRVLKSYYSKRSIRVYLTRESDKNMSLDERVTFSNEKQTLVMLSFHVGTLKEVVLYPPALTGHSDERIKPYLAEKGQEPYLTHSSLLSLSFSKAFRENMPNHGVLIRTVPYSFLSHIEAPALIVELPSFDSEVYTRDFLKKIALTIIKGLKIYEEKGLKGSY